MREWKMPKVFSSLCNSLCREWLNQAFHNSQMDNLTDKQAQALKEAQALVSLLQSEAYRVYLLPKLLTLAQEGYPNPKDFKTYEEMLPKYTFALGGTAKIKEVIAYLEDQKFVAERIIKQNQAKEGAKI